MLFMMPLPGVELAAQQVSPGSLWESEIQRFEESDRRDPPKPGAVLFIGSSSFRLWKNLAEDFPGTYVLNRGFGGSQIADSTRFAGRIITPYRPRMILLYAGDNDMAAGKSPDQVLEDFDAFVNRVRRDLPDVTIAFVSIKPSLARANLFDRMREANNKIRQYASRHRHVGYIDVFTPMLGSDGKVRPDLFIADGLHLNRSGYEIWKAVIAPHLRN
jgi:lysophospholipase L1-like esterase